MQIVEIAHGTKSENLICRNKEQRRSFYILEEERRKNIKLIQHGKTNRQKLNNQKSPCGKQTAGGILPSHPINILY